jgi:restriction endonuclease S subunit
MPPQITAHSLEKRRHSLCPKDYRTIYSSSSYDGRVLSKLATNNFQGHEIGSETYMQKSSFRFLKTVNVTSQFILDENSIEYCIPGNKKTPQQGDILIVKDGAGDGLGEVCYYQLDNNNRHDSVSAGILVVNVEESARFYVLGMVKSQHFKDFINLETPASSTIRHSKKISLDYYVPYPSNKIHNNVDDIISYISVIVRNIIDKEQQIKEKNDLIDRLIEKELRDNQSEHTFIYKLPNVSEFLHEKRTDTILYTEKYKELLFLVTNYKSGSFHLLGQSVKPGKTPGDYYFTTKKMAETYLWVTPKNITQRGLIYKTYLHTKQHPMTKKYSLIFSGIRYVGHCWFVEDDKEPIYCNQNTLIINYSKKIEEQLFILCYFSSQIGKRLQLMRRIFGTVPILYSADIVKIPIPNFTSEKQYEISKEYYNIKPFNTNLTIDNYLTKEKERNKEIGIFQLNMEILSLKEKLTKVVDDIIKGKPINIVLNL